MRKYRIFLILLLSLFINFDIFSKNTIENIEIYDRFEASFINKSWTGNPFDLEFNVLFTSPSGKKIKYFGFYSGNSIWKLFFMPDEIGKWSYKTFCSDSELNNKKGKFFCAKSDREAPLISSGKYWALNSGEGYFPLIWSPTVSDGAQWGFRGRPLSDEMVQNSLLFSANVVKANLLGIGELAIAPVGWAKEWPQDSFPYVAGKEGDEFYLPFWDELNKKLDAAAEMNIGAYIMIFGDDEMQPDKYGITAYSKKEIRLLRYIIARLACYPHILWDTGIDIGEYRDDQWINYFVEWFLQNDPWNHPVSSRSGGGSGGINPKKGTYYSTGGVSRPSRKQLVQQFFKSNVPIAQTDHWRPFVSRGDWTSTKIRTAMWRCALSGPHALYVDYNQGKVIQEEVVKAGLFIGNSMNFFNKILIVDIRDLKPMDELIKSGGNVIVSCKLGYEYVIYAEDGGPFSIFLTGIGTTYNANWYNPRNGDIIELEIKKGNSNIQFSPPTKNKDWVLHLFKEL